MTHKPRKHRQALHYACARCRKILPRSHQFCMNCGRRNPDYSPWLARVDFGSLREAHADCRQGHPETRNEVAERLAQNESAYPFCAHCGTDCSPQPAAPSEKAPT